VHGTIVTTEDTPVYAAVAVAGLGWLPDTLLARSIIIRMRRRLRTEAVEPYRRRDHAPQGKEIGRRLAGWAGTVIEAAKSMRPEMPAGVEDRAADCWEALLVVADLAGGEWPRLAREAAVALVAVLEEPDGGRPVAAERAAHQTAPGGSVRPRRRALEHHQQG
jgi:hypothetical protein